MATIPTQLPVPSEKPQDLKFNAGKIDEFVTSKQREYEDRFGGKHYTIEGLRWVAQQAISAFGYTNLKSFQAGAPLPENKLTLPNQVLQDETDGEYYRWDGDFPKSVPVGSTPNSTGGIGTGKWLSVGDASLRGELNNKDGASLIGGALYSDIRGYNGNALYINCIGSKNIFDKSSGVFYRDDLDLTSDDDDGVIIIDSLNRRWKRVFNGSIYAEWYGVNGDGTNQATSLQKAIDSVAKNHRGGEIILPRGDIGINVTIQLREKVSLIGEFSALSYNGAESHQTRIVALSEGMVMLRASSNYVSLKQLAIFGNNIAKTGFYSSSDDRSQIHTHNYFNCLFHACTGIQLHLISTSGVRALHNSVSGGTTGVYLDGYCGDSVWTDLKINTVSPDSPESTSWPVGCGMYIGSGSNNLVISGGKIEWCRAGIVIQDSQGIVISNFNFDVCRKYDIGIYDNESEDETVPDSLAGRSININNCRLLGGDPKNNTNTAGIYIERAKSVIINAVNIKRGNDDAFDFSVTHDMGAVGHHYGILTNSAYRLTITDCDLFQAGTVKCAQIYSANVDSSHDIFENNNTDGTEDVPNKRVGILTHYGAHKYTGSWDFPLLLGSIALWAASNGDFMVKNWVANGMPASDVDGNKIAVA
ncbi:hypothetical protein EDF88_3982 [Buttiauxella sp. BIGb0552]|uniref:tail fiber/spike domain-containing protein n=1 Tax=Buttiauxella sp. BIGb0552 TaxID=2485120 RepID=UPI0010E6498F|nr:hypothetical protein [Buttiauxella sp. BIGb0552]TDX14664.1 hypothetical protein EDF88_3982 [Buttiauxella sp. BIGb0552]